MAKIQFEVPDGEKCEGCKFCYKKFCHLFYVRLKSITDGGQTYNEKCEKCKQAMIKD